MINKIPKHGEKYLEYTNNVLNIVDFKEWKGRNKTYFRKNGLINDRVFFYIENKFSAIYYDFYSLGYFQHEIEHDGLKLIKRQTEKLNIINYKFLND